MDDKKRKIQNLIEKYKIHISKSKLKDEIYKWDLLDEYRGRPNTDAIDFYEEIKEIDFSNLIYKMGKAVLLHIAKERPEELRSIFKYLYDESKNLTERINYFDQETLKVYKSLGETLKHQQDERSIAAYLTYQYPEKYTFYKYTFFKNYCKLVGLKPASKNKRYSQYLHELDMIVNDYISKDDDLIKLIDELLPNFKSKSNYKLIAQDILFQMLEKENDEDRNYWIFQGNPKVYDFKKGLRDSLITNWTVSAHKDKIREGDKVILWIGGKNSGCYALAEVTSNPKLLKENRSDKLWKKEDKSTTKVDIKITHNLIGSPISKNDIKQIKELSKLNVGNQGTNFKATKEEYDAIVNLIENDKNVESNNMNHSLNTILYGPPGTGKTYNTVLRAAEIVEERTIDSYDEALEIFNDKLHSQIEFVTFHQNYSYEDFIQGLRPDTKNDKDLTFEKKDGVFKKLADNARMNLEESKKSESEIEKIKQFEEALEILKEKIIESDELNEPVKINNTAYFTAVEEDAFRYSADNWTLGERGFNGFRMKYSDLIRFYEEGITERKQIKTLENISGLAKQHATYFVKAFELVKELMPKSVKTVGPIKKKNYVIIIDEINRANISRVFGELITLIEPDKRSHGKIPMKAKLPSGDEFSVPSNLYIIGTMNTADKSIALLDIALRRRFEFVPMYPKYKIKDTEIYDVDILRRINEEIIRTKGHDFQIGHSYFMGENKDIIQRMNNKVIPLLLEYYMNDADEVIRILENAGLSVNKAEWPIQLSDTND